MRAFLSKRLNTPQSRFFVIALHALLEYKDLGLVQDSVTAFFFDVSWKVRDPRMVRAESVQNHIKFRSLDSSLDLKTFYGSVYTSKLLLVNLLAMRPVSFSRQELRGNAFSRSGFGPKMMKKLLANVSHY